VGTGPHCVPARTSLKRSESYALLEQDNCQNFCYLGKTCLALSFVSAVRFGPL
jgi:hypothetical protein